MKLSELKQHLQHLKEVNFALPNGESVPNHFHVTEVGMISKKFIDCGGQLRDEEKINFQLWHSSDYDHRLGSEKLQKIIAMSESQLHLSDVEIEVEYQGDTIGKYDLDFAEGNFILKNQYTDCLAKDNCGIPQEKPRIRISTKNVVEANSCTPGSGCC